SGNDFRRYAGDRAKVRNVSDDNRAGANQRAFADGHARQYRGIDADIGPILDADRSDLQISLYDRDIGGHGGMLGAEHFNAGPDADKFTHEKIARIQESLRSDPGAITNHEASVITALQDDAFADEDPLAELHCFGMNDRDAV